MFCGSGGDDIYWTGCCYGDNGVLEKGAADLCFEKEMVSRSDEIQLCELASILF